MVNFNNLLILLIDWRIVSVRFQLVDANRSQNLAGNDEIQTENVVHIVALVFEQRMQTAEQDRRQTGQIVEVDCLSEQFFVQHQRKRQVDDGEIVNGQAAQ